LVGGSVGFRNLGKYFFCRKLTNVMVTKEAGFLVTNRGGMFNNT
jgi:hypothetical protein